MGLTEEDVRRIVREEIEGAERKFAVKLSYAMKRGAKAPPGMTRTEAALIAEKGCDPLGHERDQS